MKINSFTSLFIISILSTILPSSTPNSTINSERHEKLSRKGKLLFPFYYQAYRDESTYGDPFVGDNETFDFIVIGSGPSGSVIANRLSEIPEWRVLLLEVGDEANPLSDVPFLTGYFQFTDYNWGYTTEPQKGNVSCWGCPLNRMWWPHGRALGGSSVINYMLHVRGHPRDYDQWASMGNPGWSYEEVLPYFKKSEDAAMTREDPGYHQKGGYLSVSDVPYRTESAHAFVRAAQEAGHAYVDYNGKRQMGVSYVQSTTRNGKRVSAEKAFLKPIRHRSNLKILKNSRATKILIKDETREAYGVEYIRHRKLVVATAKKEVILCAGALNSPQLLMLSGLGPKKHMNKLGIPLKQHLPVGMKMFDHIAFAGLNFLLNESIVIDQEKATSNLDNFVRIKYGEGAFTTILGGMEALAFVKTNASTDLDPSYPDTELLLFGGGISADKGLIYKRIFSISQEIYDAIWKPLENKYVLQVLPILLHPKSNGFMKLKSTNPYHWPKFYTRFLTDPGGKDVRILIQAIREVQRIFQSPSLKRYGAILVDTPIPGCQNHTFDSDNYWTCAIRQISSTMGDQTSTCKMGPQNDPEAVVDPKLRVYGVSNLRVADASIIPLPLAAHNAAPTYMIGEKAADLIKEMWLLDKSVLPFLRVPVQFCLIIKRKLCLDELEKISAEYEYQQENFISDKYDSTQSLTDAKEYDFIIVGSGPSGSVIANRLSEVPEWRVLLLEAGAPETKISQVPSMYRYLQTTPYDWRYTTVPQNHSCLGMDEHKCSLAAGKALGGNTAVNDMLYSRGNRRDYDIWADLGLPQWCWRDVLPYFKKIEDAHIHEFDRKHHNLGGPVHLENYQHSTSLGPHILQAGHEIGIKTVDYNGKEQLGLALPQATSKNGKRNSVAEAYLAPAQKRKNLEVKPLSRVIQILISPHTKEAYGVKYLHDGHIYVAKSTKEIILSAGAVNTPQLLMLSGIGPKEELEHLQINPVADLKVGKHLKDQISFIGLNFIFNETGHSDLQKHKILVDYLKNGKGPLTSAGIEAVGFIKTEASKEKADYPDIELIVTKDIQNKGHQHQKSNRIKKEVYDAVWAPTEGTDGFSIQVILLHPKSIGTLTLHDNDPLHHPLINTNSLTDPDDEDLGSLMAGVRHALKLAHTETLQKLGIHLNINKVPGCEHYHDEEYWKCSIKHLSTNLGQLSGTAKMGAATDEDAVVDEKLMVYGVHKLRVADASVIPVTISSNLVAPCIMIGEKAADLIKEHWK
ncbi:hypothetical protein JTB14_000814 [Gonioctena quinquepunctata]|nr:hypothetical protein JTB14_000814 [Gonioctena quinquepunctata]